MAIIKCKMCGGDIELNENMTLGVCEYCGSTMTLPKIDDEQRAAAFNRGNHFRRIGEFDKALAVYEHIVSEDDADAEAHWCCALCRFGIEYVEDPASGEWLPTCHRASFDSILEDVDYKAAVEHSSGRTARRYTVEAEKIAEVQRGILRLSQSEQPFDVFLCYKESDENGERTKDSVLAQEIYYQLTDRGLRVFFARITLEDKVGTEYEPYIFAALNSAKVMVVVGTKAEYMSAVWVRNEWSRFLSLMKRDRSKLLLPCYRDMDPYDLPEQLSVLQAYDMGKIGFMQDLIRGIEKVLGREKPQAPKETVRETVVVRGEGGGNAGALLKRGKIALEDGDWQAAGGFFDRVLDEEPENAEAYLGKFLAEKRAPTLDGYLSAQLSQAAQVETNRLSAVEPDEARIQDAVERYAVQGYFSAENIRKLYAFDGGYDSAVQALKAQRDQRQWALGGDKLFSRAVLFARGGFKATLDAALQRFYGTLDQRIADAEARDAVTAARLRQAYADQIAQVGAELSARSEAALGAKLETAYSQAEAMRKSATTSQEMREAARGFEALANYKDSARRAEACNKRAARMQREEERQRRNALILKIALCVAAVAMFAAGIFVMEVVVPANHYKEAEALLAQGDYDGAISIFWNLDDYKDAAARIQEGYYAKAEVLLADGKTPDVAIAFGKAGDYQDARARSLTLWNEIADRKTIAAGVSYTVGLKSDGTVVAMGKNDDGQCDVSGWTDIVAVSAGDDYTVGLKSDGTVVAAGDKYSSEGVSGWTDIVAVSAGDLHPMSLKSDGTVVATGGYGKDVSGWTDIIAVAAGGGHTVGLKADGTVVAVGGNDDGECDVSGWTDIVAVSAGRAHTVGLKSDGTVVAVGSNYSGACNVSGWTDIVAVAAGAYYTVGLKSDGTVVAKGYNDFGECDVSDWTDIVAIAAGTNHTVGLKSDGTVVAAGDNFRGQCNVSGWTDIKLP